MHEIAKVRAEDIDPYTHVLTIVGKGGKVAQVPLHDDLIDLARTMPSTGYWFPTYDDERVEGHVSAHAVSGAISGAMRRAGLSGTPHQLRHYYGTQLVRAGVHLRVVQELMRHSTAASTAIYTEVDSVQLYAGVRALPSAA